MTIFAGANEVNIITSALGNGAGGGDPAGYIDQQVTTFGNDFRQLMTDLRAVAPRARFVILNVPNVAGMPFLTGGALAQRQAAQRASVRMTTTVVNAQAGNGVAVVDLMCDARLLRSEQLLERRLPSERRRLRDHRRRDRPRGDRAVPIPAPSRQLRRR